MSEPIATPAKVPHPVIWTVLYIPFGAFNGFVQTALTYTASAHGIPISESAWLNGAQMLTSWLKWLWAPLVDITLTPKRWYLISTGSSAAGVAAMALGAPGEHKLAMLL